jgi:hypothetical protein
MELCAKIIGFISGKGSRKGVLKSCPFDVKLMFIDVQTTWNMNALNSLTFV